MGRYPALWLMPFLAAALAAQTVEGTVRNAATGAGIDGVKVELLRGGTPFYETVTDGAGHFRFQGVRDGEFAVRYRSPDYFSTAGASDYKLFSVSAANPTRLEVRLLPWSTLSGRVFDPAGRPVPDARLTIAGGGLLMGDRMYLRTSWGEGGGLRLGSAPMRMEFSGRTDAQGKFQVRLMPGEYILSALPPAEARPPAPEPGGTTLAWKRSYYPAASESEASSKLVVLAGGEISGLELRLLAVPARTVRGRVLAPDGAPAPKVTILAAVDGQTRTAISAADGTFEITAVPEGEWYFAAEADRGGVRLQATGWVEVPRHDVDGVELRLAAPLTLGGKVIVKAVEGAPPLAGVNFILARIEGLTARADDGGLPGRGAALAASNRTGEITVNQLYPGTYRLSPLLQPTPAPFYLAEVRLGDADLLSRDIQFPGGGEALTFTYETGSGPVSGTAAHCAGGGVLLLPRDPALRRFFSRSAPCDDHDRYQIQGVRPGNYYALAFAANAPVPVLTDELLQEAVKVTVEAAAVTADPKTVTRPIW